MAASWTDFARDRTVVRDAADAWSLLESVEDADAGAVIAFLEAVMDALPDLSRWEPMFDPVLRVPGLVEAWRGSREPVRSRLGHGLLREVLVDARELPDELCERVAASYLDEQDGRFLFHQLADEGAHWPRGRFVGALRRLALASDELLAHGLARYAMAGATPRDAMVIAARAETDLSMDEEPVASWGLLRDLPASSVDVLEAIARDVVQGASNVQLSSRASFRIFRALLDRGRATPEHDALLSPECLDWVGDLGPACGSCGGREATSPHQPSPALVHLLTRLPVERSIAYLDAGSATGRDEPSALVRAWLTEGPPRFRVGAGARADALAALPDALRDAVWLAGARLMVASDGHLPRLQQREVLAALRGDDASDEVAPPDATRGDLASAIRNMSARTNRLLELNAPLAVVLRDASRLRMLERLDRLAGRDFAAPAGQNHATRDGADENAERRTIALASFVLRDLAGDEPRITPAIEQLDRLAAGRPDVGPNAAAGLERASDASRDAAGQLGHFAFCALDIARSDDERTDQDDLYDIAERVVRGPEGGSHDAEVTRSFWLRWLLVHVPRAAMGGVERSG